MPTQVVNPSVSRAARPHGTALTVFVEMPSEATTFNPGPEIGAGTLPPGLAGGAAGETFTPVAVGSLGPPMGAAVPDRGATDVSEAEGGPAIDGG
jgi:hypothetical protein